MKNIVSKIVARYLNEEDGLVTIEWVGIAAVVVIAGILITTFVMNGTDVAAGDVNAAAQAVATGAKTQATAAAAGLSTIGDGTIN